VKAALINEIRFAHSIKSHLHREFAIAGIKVMDGINEELLIIAGFGDWEIICTECMFNLVNHPQFMTQPEAFLSWLDDFERLIQWKNSKLCNEIVLSQSVGKRNCNITHYHIQF
jgi:hypothetical protein